MSKQITDLRSYLDHESHEDRYLLNSESEIRALLNYLQKKRSHITGHLNNSNDIFSTSILAVEKNHITMSGISEESLSKRIVDCSKLLFSTFHAGVPVRFISSLIAKQAFDGEVALTIPFPTEVLWRQRREFFRAPVPLSTPALCEMDLNTGEISRNPLADISVGGLGLMVSTPSTPLNRGMLINECQIELPGFGSLKSDIQVCNESLLELRSGHAVKRYGCRFINLQQRDQSLLQRYVIKLESDMHASRANS